MRSGSEYMEMKKSELTHGSLFSGIGGFELGAEMAGIDTLWNCEIVKRKPRNRVIVDGVERKVCSRCGSLLLLSCFYDRTIHRNGKAYYIKTSWCKMCVSEDNRERNKRKKSN